MQFSSYLFMLVFLPVVVTIYYLLNRVNIKTGKTFLILMSVGFYFCTGIKCVIVLAISMALNYFISQMVKGKAERGVIGSNKWLIVGIAANIVILAFFKYCNFFADTIGSWLGESIVAEVALPMGISFYTFQQIMYLVSVYRGEMNYSVDDYLFYILYFPKLIMGPITNPVELVTASNDVKRKKVDFDNIVLGIQLFVCGLFKKVIIADTLAGAVSWGQKNLTTATAIDLAIIVLSYTLQIYFDFSGYSDMAVGVSKMLNIELPINFDSPYQACSVSDFWKRWHMSLTNFLTRYVYIPLGGNRKGLVRTCINIMIVFLISGIWHGSSFNFIMWGGIYGVLMVLERLLSKWLDRIPNLIRWVFVLGMVNILWVFFWTDSVSDATYVMGRILSFEGMNVSSELMQCFCLKEFTFISDIAGLAFITNHLWGLSMWGFLALSLAICLFIKNIYKWKIKRTAGTLVFTLIAFTYCLLSIATQTAGFIYSGF